MRLDIVELLELLPGFTVDRRGKNLTGPCPFCGHDEFGISLEDGHRYGCYRKKNCGATGNIYSLLRYFGKLDKVLKEKVTKLPNKIENLVEEEVEVEEVPAVKMPMGWKRVYSDVYLESRGFKLEDFQKYIVGRTSLDVRVRKDYVIFACCQEGEIKGWVARHYKSKKEIDVINKARKLQKLPLIKRYVNSESDFNQLCYGIDEITENTTTLIIVEGIFDKKNTDKVMKLDENEEVKCVATYKASVSDNQKRLIRRKGKNIKTIVLIYDSDVVKIIKNTSSDLQERFNVYIGFHPDKDPGDMNEEDFMQVFDNLKLPIEFKCFLEVNKI